MTGVIFPSIGLAVVGSPFFDFGWHLFEGKFLFFVVQNF